MNNILQCLHFFLRFDRLIGHRLHDHYSTKSEARIEEAEKKTEEARKDFYIFKEEKRRRDGRAIPSFSNGRVDSIYR
jgi:hypothetical protein